MDTDQQEAVGKAMWPGKILQRGLPTGPNLSIGPNPDILAIIRLYLERYPDLADEDRKLLRGVVAMLMNPPLVVGAADGLEFMSRQVYEAAKR